MSFSLTVVVDHPDGYISRFEVVVGQTYNLRPMWSKALDIDSTSDLNGKTCAELREPVHVGLEDIARNQAAYEELEPANGWGDFEGFEKTFTKFAKMVWRHPTGRVEWSG